MVNNPSPNLLIVPTLVVRAKFSLDPNRVRIIYRYEQWRDVDMALSPLKGERT